MTKVEHLIKKGIRIANPAAVFIDEDVDVERISKDVVIHAGSRIIGRETYIGPGARLGFEAPVTIENCYVGPKVSLKGGFFSGAVFLEGASCGSGSHIRQGTILEEYASVAHTVGLKQTILFLFVTLGSLINFCDCLMAGGTSRKNHSEVGSSYIHFNYTPNQDKATPSLLGDVPRGVMLNQSPIFLGGQGGLVGPCYLNYGTVVAAGTIWRHDQPKENHLVFGGSPRKGSMPYKPGGYPNLKRIISHNVNYLGNLGALRQWYAHVRSGFVGSSMPQPLFEGLQTVLNQAIDERVRQLERLVQNIEKKGPSKGLQEELCTKWTQMKAALEQLLEFEGDLDDRSRFQADLDTRIGGGQVGYIQTIQELDAQAIGHGVQWLNGIVEKVNFEVLRVLPSCC